jgi:hypothetical protein
MAHVATNLEFYTGKLIGKGDCVEFVKACTDLSSTATWKEGVKVNNSYHLTKGTAIATFQNGKYTNDKYGKSHAAIYLYHKYDESKNLIGIRVLDQWKGDQNNLSVQPNQVVHERTIRFRGGVGHPCNDGDAFSVID